MLPKEWAYKTSELSNGNSFLCNLNLLTISLTVVINLVSFTFQNLIHMLDNWYVNTIISILHEFDILFMTEEISCYKCITMLHYKIQNLLQIYVTSSSLIVHICSYLH